MIFETVGVELEVVAGLWPSNNPEANTPLPEADNSGATPGRGGPAVHVSRNDNSVVEARAPCARCFCLSTRWLW